MAVSTIEQPGEVSARRWMPGLALSALISTILLIGMGSIVRVTGHGLGCPDWPLCYGRVIPPALTGAWVEFTHRFLGAVAGLQIVLLGIFAWRDYRRQVWVFWPAMATVVLLAVQVSLGGLHVIFEIPPVTGWIHTGVAMLIAGLLAVQVTNLLPSTQAMRGNPIFRSRGFAAWLSVAAVATYGLLLTGSFVTRSGASLACPSFPLCGSNAAAIRRLIDIQMLHRYVAFSVAFLTIVLFVWIVTRQKGRRLTNLTYGIGALLLVQFGLGVGNVLLRLPMWTRVLHLTVATTFWAGMVVLWAVCFSRQPGPKAVVASSDQSKD